MLHGYLRQATGSQIVIVGPFISDVDFKTAQTGLTINATDVKICKIGGTSVNKNSGGGTHRVNGNYALTFDAVDTSAVGEFFGSIAVSGALQVVFKCQVLEEVVYDKLFTSGAAGEGNQLDDIEAGVLALPTAEQTADEVATRPLTVGALTPAAADTIADAPVPEPTGTFLWGSATMRNIMGWVGKMHRDKVTQTGTQQQVYDAAGESVIASSNTTDDGTTTTRGGF